MSNGSPVERLAAEGIINEDGLNDDDKEVINSLTADEVTMLIDVRKKIHYHVPLERDHLLGIPF